MSAHKLLLFRTGGRVFAVDAGAVREILPDIPSTRIPGSPAAVRGLVNVRGTLVTVVDAALAIGIGDRARGAAEDGSAFLVLVERAAHSVGLVVDEVLDLATVDDAGLEPGGAEAVPGARPGVIAATGSAGEVRFAQLETDALLGPLLG